jgi:hypothetical protein
MRTQQNFRMKSLVMVVLLAPSSLLAAPPESDSWSGPRLAPPQSGFKGRLLARGIPN